MKVLITGADGFVGSALLPALSLRGHAVRAAARRPLPHADSVAVGDIALDTDWSQALKGCEAIVHLAARVHVMRDSAADPLAEFRRVNTQPTASLARAAADAGVRRLVFVSTAKVLGESSPRRGFSDSDPPAPADPYAISKREAEDELRAIAANTGLEVVILRPPLVYGPRVGANFMRLMRWIDARRPLPFGNVANRRSLLYVGNLASAIAAALEHPHPIDGTFLVCDDESVSTPELARRIATALGRDPRLWKLPPSFLRLAGLVTGRGAELDRLLGDFALDASGIRNILRWTPPFSLSQGLAATAAWYRSLAR